MAAAMAMTASRTFFLSSPHHYRTFFPSRTFFLTHASSSPVALSPDASISPRKKHVVEILHERGLMESITSENLKSSTNLKAYCGFDPTAESLHLGNLIGLVVLSWFKRCGHVAVALVGGATGRVGDPSGKSAERPELEADTLEKNSNAIKSLIKGILGRNDEKNYLILDNYDWWKNVSLLDFLRDVGKYARVGTMMAKESVKKRLSSEEEVWAFMQLSHNAGAFLQSSQYNICNTYVPAGMSYTEFTYQLLQGYDFLYLFKNKGVNVQIGGSDQWGNITAGTELIRKILQIEGAFGLTFPLLLKSDGTKFGKSEEGAIWLNPNLMSPYKFYQYFISVPDVDVIRFLKILTFLTIEEINELENSMKQPGYVPNSIQRKLAEEVTKFVHGEEGLRDALNATEALRPGAKTELDSKSIESIANDVPSCVLPCEKVLNCSLVDIAVSSGLMASKGAVRRLLKQGGLYLNNVRIDSEEKVIEEEDVVDGKVLLLSAGKKNKMVIRIE